jgi:hypothetical protein
MLPQHAALLDASGIDPEVRRERGYRSAITQADLGRLGFSPRQRIVPALVAPVWGVNGDIVLYQARPDQPRIVHGKPAKYELPKGCHTALDVPPRVRGHLADPTIPLFICDGIRQADAAVSRGWCAVAILGIWNWRGSNSQGGTTALPAWENVALNHRPVYLAFNLSQPAASAVVAVRRLKAFLETMGAIVHVIVFPASEHGTSNGLDDYLAAGHSLDDLLELGVADLPAPEGEEEQRKENRYRATDEGLFQELPGKDEVILRRLTNFTARIVAELLIDDGVEIRREFEIEAIVNGTTTRFSLPAEQFDSMTWVIPTLGAQAVVCAGYGTKDLAREGIQILSGNVPVATVYSHLGWRTIAGQRVYLHAGGAIGANAGAALAGEVAQRPTANANAQDELPGAGSPGPLPRDNVEFSSIRVRVPEALGAYLLPAPPKGSALREAVQDSLLFLQLRPAHIILLIYATIWRSVLGLAEFSILLTGLTGELKTTLACLALQHFGPSLDRYHLPASWTSTANFLSSLAFLAKDTLLLIDDWVLHGSQADVDRANREADRVLRGQGNRSGRGRCRPDGTPKEAKPPRGLILVTGEAVPSGASLNARFLNVEVKKGELFNAANLSLLKELQANAARGQFAAAMSGFLAWLAPQYEAQWAATREQVERLAEVFRGDCRHPRAAMIAGELLAGLEVFMEFAKAIGAIKQEGFDRLWVQLHEAVRVVLKANNEQQFAEDPVERFLELLAAVLLSGRGHIAVADGSPPPTDPEAWGWRKQPAFLPKANNAPPRTALGHQPTKEADDDGDDDVPPKEAGQARSKDATDDDDNHFVEYEERWRLLPQGPRIGWFLYNDLFLQPEATLGAVQRMARECGTFVPFSSQTLGKCLFQRGLLVNCDSHRGRYTVRENIQGRRSNFLMLKPNAILTPEWRNCYFLEPGYEHPECVTLEGIL